MRLLFLAGAVSLASAAGAAAPTVFVSDTPEFMFSVPGKPAGEMPVINPNAPIGKACPPTSRTQAARRGGRLEARHLTDLPPADMYMAVDRRVDGCQLPIIAGYGFGAGR